MDPCVAHVDMDAFFASVELLRRPELRGKPVVVATGTDPQARGVVMAASYEARRYGVHSALPLAIAHRRCPQMVLVPRDIALYRRASQRVMEILRRFADRVEVAGLDEAYLDLSGSPAPKARARQLKREIRSETGLVCSVGLAPNKLLAKIASDLDKPDGLRVLRPQEMLDAVGDRPAALIPGVGPRTAERLAGMGIRTVADLAGAVAGELEAAFGPKLGHALRARANGHDERRVETERVQKSESRERTFSTDVSDGAVLRDTVARLADSVCRSLDEHSHAGRTVTLKIRLRPFRTHTRSRTLDAPTAEPQVVREVALALLDAFDRDAPVRLLGVGVAGLSSKDAGEHADEGESSTTADAAAEPLTLELGV
ncbi:MAG TPA: DNA polymerase IV [Solirubrobacterales bacterium]|nr:DNA polymerase IV [Solirubrobacterales bacterium]